MAVRGDEVASSIDASVRDAIEKMVGEIRSSIEDVRAAVDSQLNAALQSMQADVKSTTFLPQIKKSLSEFEDTFAGAKKGAPGADATRVKQAIQNVEKGKSQVDVLNALLEQCLNFGSRAALLILKGETFSGWKGVGFSTHGGNDEMVKRFNAAPGLLPELDRVLRDERVVHWDGASLASRLGVTGSKKAILVPMVIKDKVSAAIYVDAVAEDLGKFDANSIEILVFTTGLLVDTLAIRKKIPSPSLSDAAAAPAAAHQAAPQRPAPRTPTMAGTTPRPAPAPAPSSATVAFPAMAPAPAPAMAKSSFHSGAVPAHHEDRPTTQYVPPSGTGRGVTFGATGTEDSKKHDEARRFARLLVSEIKLYNEAKVEQGRKSRDLYERLKDDIDRSRQMYDERISEDVRKSSNYFYDELVRILADGSAAALGL
jgi:hypothetical protein